MIKDVDWIVVVEINVDRISTSKSGFEYILCHSISWSSFDLNCWNFLIMSQLNCLSGQKYWLNYHGGSKCWSIEGNLSSKYGFEFILIFFI